MALRAIRRSHLSIDVEADGLYYCHDHDAEDRSERSDTLSGNLAQVEAWISARQDTAGRVSDTAAAYARAGDWAGLKAASHQVYVTWSEGLFHASLAGLYEAGTGDTVAEAVNRVAELLCHLLQAPANLAPQLNITTELDEAATARLRQQA